MVRLANFGTILSVRNAAKVQGRIAAVMVQSAPNRMLGRPLNVFLGQNLGVFALSHSLFSDDDAFDVGV